jgi:hypothetical protein
METHVKVVGVLNIVFAALGLCSAAVLGLIFAGSAAAIVADADADARVALPVLGLTGSALVGFLVVLSLPGLIVGIGIVKRQPWARIGGIVMAVMSLLVIPFGTVFGVYALWVLFSPDTERLFTPPSMSS